MKNLVIATLLFSAATAAHADNFRLVSSDDSPITQICIAAVDSYSAAVDLASEQGIGLVDFDKLFCNGMPLKQFARKYRVLESKVTPSYTFRSTSDDALSKLCVAAVKSDSEFAALKASLAGEFKDVETEVMCNDMPLRNFARKYRSATYTASIN